MKSVAQEETKNDAYDKKAVWRESSLVACIYHTLLAKYIEEPSISSCLPPSDLVGSSFLQGKKGTATTASQPPVPPACDDDGAQKSSSGARRRHWSLGSR